MIVIAQLSDIHIKENADNPIESRGLSIAAAISSLLPEPDGFLVLCTGDVAYAGADAEYERAKHLFSTIRSELARRHPAKPQEWILIPGNHDCNFGVEGDVRPALLDTVGGRLPQISRASGIVEQCIAIQSSFFDFYQQFLPDQLLSTENRLVWERVVRIGETQVRMRCLNTSWMSRRSEKQGTLFFPVQVIPELTGGPDDLVITLLHHPYNWFEANNARTLRTALERTSDLILTGHEHDGVWYRKISPSGEVVHYTEGAFSKKLGATW